MTTAFRDFPICVFSFNRPDTLGEVLTSLQRAIEVAAMRGPIILFQDGAYNEFSRQEKASQDQISECKTVFQRAIPHGVIMESPMNLGIGLNIYRGEKWTFEEMGYGGGLFFEDDMVISPRYFVVMEKLYAQALLQPRIAMFSAYGASTLTPIAEQLRDIRGIDAMHHNWCFCLLRDAWLAREKYTREYMSLLGDCDYRDRPLHQISAWYGRMGWPPMPTNQDRAKTVVLNTLGFVRITSRVICARYIGEVGQHYEPAEFRRLGFDQAIMLEGDYPNEDWDFDDLTDAQIDALVRKERAKLLGVRLGLGPFAIEGEIMETARILRKVGGESLMLPSDGALIDMITGLYGDGWTANRIMIVFATSADVRSIEIRGRVAPHLPPETEFRFKLNDQDVATILLAGDEEFTIKIPVAEHLFGLEKIVVGRCAVAIDPFSVGYSPDRRPLGFNVSSLVVVDGTGQRVVTSGAILARDFGRSGS
jgi:hypothetical protein